MDKPKFAVLGDIHGNWEALSAVLADAERENVKRYVCVGDVVGYNADPAKCLERIMELDCITVRGNHDHYCAHETSLRSFHPLAAKVMRWTREQLSAVQVDYLSNLRMSCTVNGFLMVHSTLDMPDKWGYVFEELEAESHFAYQTTTLCFYGHTHFPVVFEKGVRVQRLQPEKTLITLGRKYFINVGSVGQPRDGIPDASYVIYDAATRQVVFRRVPYDIPAAQAKIRLASLPERLAVRLELGR